MQFVSEVKLFDALCNALYSVGAAKIVPVAAVEAVDMLYFVVADFHDFVDHVAIDHSYAAE